MDFDCTRAGSSTPQASTLLLALLDLQPSPPRILGKEGVHCWTNAQGCVSGALRLLLLSPKTVVLVPGKGLVSSNIGN